MKIRWRQRRRLGSVLLCLFLLTISAQANAQSEPAEPIPQPPPSVEEFSLPPGPSTPTPQPAPTGPVDDSSPTTVEPSVATPAEPVTTETEDSKSPVDRPAPAAIAPESGTQPNRTSTPRTSPTQANPEPRQVTTETVQQPEPEPGPQEEIQAESVESDAPVLEDRLDAPSSQTTDQSSITPGKSTDWSVFLLTLAGVLLAITAVFLWKKRATRTPLDAEDNLVPNTNEPVSKQAKREPNIPEATPSQLANDGEVKQNTTSDGFVTTKVRKINPPAQTQQVSAALSDRLHIEFQARSASSTLVNAIVAYSVNIENRSDQPIQNLRISGTMIQADHKIVETAAASQGQLLHEIAILDAGQSETVTGDIRLPLAAFEPIEFQSQKLFVPLILLRFDHADSNGNQHMQAANFLVGTEHTPPRDKMAPFRLDLGPRNFGDVAHRPFQS